MTEYVVSKNACIPLYVSLAYELGTENPYESEGKELSRNGYELFDCYSCEHAHYRVWRYAEIGTGCLIVEANNPTEAFETIGTMLASINQKGFELCTS